MLHILLRIGSIFGLTPPSKYSKWNTDYHYYYALFLLVVLLICSIYSVFCTVLEYYPVMSKPEMVIDFLNCYFLIMQGTAAVVSYLRHPQLWHRFINGIEDNIHGLKQRYCCLVILGIVHLVTIIRICGRLIIWFPISDIKIDKSYIFRNFHEYYGTFTTCIIVYANYLLMQRFSSMNRELELSRFRYGRVKHIQTIYRKLILIIEDFNTIFGYQTLFIIIGSVIKVLENFQNTFLLKTVGSERKFVVSSWSILSAILRTVIKQIEYNKHILSHKFLATNCCNNNVMCWNRTTS